MSDHIYWEKDIYQWRKGFDKDDITVLTALNNITKGITVLEDYGIECICERMNVMSEYERVLKDYIKEFDFIDFMVKIEVMRALLIGGKINYNFLADHLAKAVTEYGYIPEEANNEKV